MKELNHLLHETLETRLIPEGYELDLIPVPHWEWEGSSVKIPSVTASNEKNSDEFGFFLRIRKDPPSDSIAIELMDSANSQENLNERELLHYGELLFRSGDFNLAKNIYRSLLKSSRQIAVAHYWLARCDESERNIDSAIHHYENSIAYQSSLETYQAYSSMLIRSQQDEKAARVLERAAGLKNLTITSRFEIIKAAGNAWCRCENAENSEKAYLRALELNPSSADIQINLASLYLKLGNFQKAREYFETALASEPENEKAWVGMGSVHYALGERRLAHEHFSKALGIQLNNPTAVYYLVKCAYEIKSFATAARLVKDYIEIAPVSSNLLYTLAGLQYQLGRFSEAKKSIEKTLEIEKGHSGAEELLSVIRRLESSGSKPQ